MPTAALHALTHMAAASSSEQDALVAELATLQARQAALRDRISSQNARDAEAISAAAATFDNIPAYIEKVRRVQQMMETLAERTSQMRARADARCNALVQEQ